MRDSASRTLAAAESYSALRWSNSCRAMSFSSNNFCARPKFSFARSSSARVAFERSLRGPRILVGHPKRRLGGGRFGLGGTQGSLLRGHLRFLLHRFEFGEQLSLPHPVAFHHQDLGQPRDAAGVAPMLM